MSFECQDNPPGTFERREKRGWNVLSATLEEGLRPYRIGEKVHALRLSRKLGLVELGRHTGLSAALLSKIERGKLYPPLPTLLKIALVFGVGLDHFISDERRQNPVAIVRKGERKRFPERAGIRHAAYEFESLDFAAVERKTSAYYALFRPIAAEDARPHQHPGAEFLHVLHGRLVLRVRDEDHVLAAGDSVYFNAAVPHSYRAEGAARCDAIVVTAP